MFELFIVITSIVGGATALFGLMAGSDKVVKKNKRKSRRQGLIEEGHDKLRNQAKNKLKSKM
ncbi:hypothetical protein ECH_0105 [Ehrlichia chaffeensis str. Arkansas]|uniref:Uncharacterized protein n=1 Tax=Ehrlichia chaffeensis (strain ATCC CRL-10679 / Arkansas) TaxID=205920 RepID=Q2GI00_EHRCR|nr:hypothetical protein [Ehrlichia chaffeensis]ABD45459.1 hypothetical protein ECH_0105 [Ehrlichia chaffeensis str. Arkansas]